MYNEVNKSAFEFIYKELQNMSIGNTIKKLRRERDITQEQLAEYIGISSQAISQWETDKTAPDISQLPVLAHIFGVSTDEILGVDIQKNEEKIKAILDEAQVFYAKGEFEKSAEILKNGLRKFPRSYKLMVELTFSLRDTKETIDLCHKILAECTDSEIRDSAMQNMIFAYNNSGDRQNALKYSRTCSHAWCSREDYLLLILNRKLDDERDEARTNIQEYVAYLSNRLMSCLENLSHEEFGYSDEDRLKLLRQSATIGETIYCDGDYHYHAQYVARAYMFMSKIYAKNKDAENTLTCLEKQCELEIHFDTYDWNAEKTSPAMRGYVDGGWIPEPDGNKCHNMLIQLDEESTVYDFIRDDERFKAVVSELKKYAK